ncbi:MAG: hypothetical protein DRG09_05945 [Epsilonproteobacteria bacterium]|nr:MAG: hypothetical protein DRG09_05945 [Campylobacterota bacterium]
MTTITTLNTLGKTMIFLLIASTIASAKTQENTSKENTLDSTEIYTIYQSMTTAQLQKEVEKHSENGNLSFALGKELIKRWTKS